jgi:hypothetical protein
MIPAVLTLTVLLVGCRVEQRIELDPDLSGNWELEAATMPFAAAAMEDLAMIGGYESATVFYDEALSATRRDLDKKPDIRFHDIQRTGDAEWSVLIEFTDIERLLGSSETGGITELINTGNETSLTLRLNRDNASHLETLVPLLTDPAFSLFNPAATEGIDEETYVTQILGFTFGEENIPSIRRAGVGLELSLPGPVTDVTGGRQTGERTVRFESPFTRFMVPDEEINWSVRWRNDP